MAKRILIIDDEELIIKTLSKLLEKEKYDVVVAKNGQDAIIMMEEEQFDLIISDIRMPGINGVETIKSIQGALQKNNAKKVPVIFITGYADQDIEKAARDLTPVDYIYKPFDIVDLLDKIKKAVG